MLQEKDLQKNEEKRLEATKEMRWSVVGAWNDINAITKQRGPKVRDYVSPSDIGKDYWGRYQKMTGVPVTNPYDERILRVFSAGDEFHNMMANVFRACGILINTQDLPDEDGNEQWSLIPETEDMLGLVGKYDALAGGKPNLEQVEKHCDNMHMSQFIKERTVALAKAVLKEYPDGLPKLLYDFKSINSMAFWHKKDYLTEAYPWHVMQVWCYLKANNVEEGRVLYISKDDLMTAEFPVFLNDEKLIAAYEKDVKEMTYFIRNKIEPPKPENIVFNEKGKIRFQKNKEKYIIEGCYEKNWEVERSSWFQLLTGFKEKDKWENSLKPKIKDKNDEIKANYIAENFEEEPKKSKVDKK